MQNSLYCLTFLIDIFVAAELDLVIYNHYCGMFFNRISSLHVSSNHNFSRDYAFNNSNHVITQGNIPFTKRYYQLNDV